ncbi:hypothetical protein PYW07_007152 [Mythimna separata]|uniref:Uncharacterized protein n=1 Tax=Mythimna separata TaxID=271217 RepID=A0AAD7Z3H6_MYTSE|nr:hypothetical protein PYW07_007152 [Mythimna separata]
MVERTNDSLQAVSKWGEANLVGFNTAKTQACLFTAKRSSFTLAPAFRNVSLVCTIRLQLLGVEILSSSDLNFGRFIESKAKLAARKLGVLAKVLHIRTASNVVQSTGPIVCGVLQPHMGWSCEMPPGSFGLSGKACEEANWRSRSG